MAHKKAASSTDNGRDSISKRLGVKLFGGQVAKAGNIIVRQRGTRFHAGVNTYLGKDFSLHAKVDGIVSFQKRKYNRTFVNILPLEQVSETVAKVSAKKSGAKKAEPKPIVEAPVAVKEVVEAAAPEAKVEEVVEAAAPEAVVEEVVEAAAPEAVVEEVVEAAAPEAAVEEVVEAAAPEAAVEEVVEAAAPEAVVEEVVEAAAPEAVVEEVVEAAAPEAVVEEVVEAAVPEEVVEVAAPEAVVEEVVEVAAPEAVVEEVVEAAAPEAVVEEVVEAATDDLKIIEGVGPKIEGILQEAGLDSWAKVAAATPDQIREILKAAGPRYNSKNPTTWPKQAELADQGKFDELKAWQDELDGGKE